jgi:hydroxymethylpyrimidine kinase/phosphomethylpyrimidine kinase
MVSTRKDARCPLEKPRQRKAMERVAHRVLPAEKAARGMRHSAVKTVLTVGGLDPSNGAGITKDIEIFTAMGFHGISIPTSLVVQGPKGVESVSPVPPDVVSAMLLRAGEDFALSGIKLGALTDADYVEKVGEFVAARKGIPIVLDPVMAAKNGRLLISDEGLEAMKKYLFPLATCLTPNLEEAQALLNEPVGNLRAMERAAKRLCRMGPVSVLLKGGHLAGEPIDVLFDGRKVLALRKERAGKTVHGTGCMLSAALLAFLALGYPLREAFLEAEQMMERIIGGSSQPGQEGYFYGLPGIEAARDADRWRVLRAMHGAAARLADLNMVELIPAVQMNVGYAIRGAMSPNDVAAFPGRIGQHQGKVLIKGAPEFGASSHVARLCLACMRRFPQLRAAANIKYDEAVLEEARTSGLSVLFSDRKREPQEWKAEEGKSLDFIVDTALAKAAVPPDIIYDHGDVGKEPIIRLFARDPEELIGKMEMIRPCKTS